MPLSSRECGNRHTATCPEADLIIGPLVIVMCFTHYGRIFVFLNCKAMTFLRYTAILPFLFRTGCANRAEKYSAWAHANEKVCPERRFIQKTAFVLAEIRISPLF